MSSGDTSGDKTFNFLSKMTVENFPLVLYKYGRKEHNILRGCNTIQLNTIYNLREAYKDQELINDPDEGKGSGFDSNNNSYNNASLVPNGLVYCVSMDKKLSEDFSSSFDETYDDFYAITNVKTFLKRLITIVKINLSLNDIKNKYSKRVLEVLSIHDYSLFEIKYLYGTVNYNSKKHLNIYLPNDRHNFNFEVAFAKDKKYAFQNEYRFCFFLYHPHPALGYLPLKKAPKIVDLRIIKPGMFDISDGYFEEGLNIRNNQF